MKIELLNTFAKILLGVSLVLFLPVLTNAEVYTTPDGYQFEVNLVPEKTEIMLGEPIYIDFEVKNLSEVSLGMVDGGNYRNALGRDENFSIKVVDENQIAVHKPEIKYTFGGVSRFAEIPVNEKRSIRLYLPHWATFEKTGNYAILCERDFVVRKYEKENSSFYLSKGQPVKSSAKINVVTANYQKMGAIIDSLGRRMIEGEQTALKLMPFVNDKRTIKYFVEALKTNIWVMPDLAKFNDNLALNAILAKTNDANDEVRRIVSVTLSHSIHPQAPKYLLKMRNDKFYPIRLDVVHFLGKTKTAEAAKILKEMTMDENEIVRNEAKRYLEERGEKLK